MLPETSSPAPAAPVSTATHKAAVVASLSNSYANRCEGSSSATASAETNSNKHSQHSRRSNSQNSRRSSSRNSSYSSSNEKGQNAEEKSRWGGGGIPACLAGPEETQRAGVLRTRMTLHGKRVHPPRGADDEEA